MSLEKQQYASKLWWDSKSPVQQQEAVELYSTGKTAGELSSYDILELWRCFMLSVARRASDEWRATS